MSAKQFLEVLEQSGLVEDRVLNELRRQVESKGKVSVAAITKVLVDKGHLTKSQAKKLAEKASLALEEPAEPAPDAARKKRHAEEDDLLGLAPFDDEEETPPAPNKSPAKASPTPAPADDDIVMLEDAGGLTPIEDAGAGLTPVGPTPGLTPIGGGLSPLTPLGPEPTQFDPFSGGAATDLSTADPFSAPSPLGGGGSTTAPIYVPKKKETRWDTKLILGVSTTLLILLLIGGALLWNFLAVPADQMYEAAEKSYREAAYSDAKEKFEKYLDSYPDDDNASKARVRVQLVRIRQDVGDPQRGLTTAKEVIPEILKEKDADMAREEFPGLLPQIPEGFINRAKQAKDTKAREELLAKAKEAMALLNDAEVVPTSRRTLILPQLNRMTEDIGLIERTINQENELAAAVTNMGTAESAGDTVKAFQIYHDLLRKYPGVRDDVSLREAVMNISARERSLVKVVEEPIAPLTEEEARASQFRVVLASRAGGGETKPQNPVATIFARGSLYALDVGSGQMLWSRFVGNGLRNNPVRVSSQADADVLILDRQRAELVRLKSKTGELVWRLPVGENCSEPTVAGARIYVSTQSGRILEIDGVTGESRRHVVIPQKLSTAPAAVSDQPYLFQLGEHSNLYVLNADSLQCEDVIYLGHKAATVEVPPLILLGHVFFAENSANNARVHVLKIRNEGEGQKLFPTQDPILTNGRVVVPLVVYSRRLLILTDRGEIRVFDVDKTKNENSVTDTGKLPPTLSEPLIGYPLADGTTLWIADNKLTKYTVQVTRKEITRDPAAITAVGDTFVAPLQLFGNTLVHTRRMAGSTGVTVACVNVDNPRQVVWQTHLGVPAGRIAVNPQTNEIVAISSAASLYKIDGEVIKNGYTDTPMATAGGGSSLSFTRPIEFENGVAAFFNPADNKQLLVYDPAATASRLRIVPLQITEGKIPCDPVAFQGGLLAPVDAGSVYLLKLSDGSNQVFPFQPKLEPGTTIQWRRPAVVGEGGREFVIADDRRNIYRVGIKDQPSPQLAEVANNKLDVELASGLAAAGDTVYGCVRSTGGDLLVAISLAELKVVKEFDLKGGRVTWGPEQVDDTVMVVVDDKELRCFGPGQTERWQQPAVMHGHPAGRPLVEGEDYVFASVAGTVWRVARATGQEAGKAEVGEPLGAGPIAFRGKLLLCGNDGSLHVINMPVTAGTSG